MKNMIIENAKYSVSQIDNSVLSISATIEGITMSVPLDPRNRHYKEIMRQVKVGTLVIQPADEPEEQPVGE